MDTMIYNPLEEYRDKFKDLHLEKTTAFFEKLTKQSGVNIEENRKTVEEYNTYRENLKKLKKKLNLYRFLRVLMIITILPLPFVFMKMTPAIRKLREDINFADDKANELLEKAKQQMQPLNSLFTDRDALDITEETIPMISFDTCLTAKQEADMVINYDYTGLNNQEQSTLDVLAGKFNENPFIFENKKIHHMGLATYHGYKTISWVETYRDSDGKIRTRTRTQRLEATVVKPKPYYHTQVVLNYGAQAAPDLSFSRDATHLDNKSEKEIEKYIKKGEKLLKKKTDKAISGYGDFTSMSNTDFEVLFDALNRTNEVQFRMLFTPLAQTNMVDLIRMKDGYGDDFNFFKERRMNRIVTTHSQGRNINLLSRNYVSYSYDIAKENFINGNTDFFKAVYFDLAPVLAIPVYQERPVQSLKPIPDYSQMYSLKECEALANMINRKYVVHPDTVTDAILKSEFLSSENGVDTTRITAYSYKTEPRVDIVSVRGDDGNYHDVSVPWDEYIPLSSQRSFRISNKSAADGKNGIAGRNGLYIFD